MTVSSQDGHVKPPTHGGDWGDTPTSQGTPRTAGQAQKRGGRKEAASAGVVGGGRLPRLHLGPLASGAVRRDVSVVPSRRGGGTALR